MLVNYQMKTDGINIMKKQIIRIEILIKISLLAIMISFNYGCVDSLNSPYPGTLLSEKPKNDSTTENINPPTNLSIGEFSEDSIYGLWWNDNTVDEDGFEVWRKDGDIKAYRKISDLPSNSTAFNDTIIDKNIAYLYKVRAVKGEYYSFFSNEVSTLQNLSLIAPSELNGTVISSTTNVTLSWKDNSTNELGFIIERKIINEYEFSEVVRVGPDSETWTDTSDKLQVGLTVSYIVKAYSTAEQSDNSNTFSITL